MHLPRKSYTYQVSSYLRHEAESWKLRSPRSTWINLGFSRQHELLTPTSEHGVLHNGRIAATTIPVSCYLGLFFSYSSSLLLLALGQRVKLVENGNAIPNIGDLCTSNSNAAIKLNGTLLFYHNLSHLGC